MADEGGMQNFHKDSDEGALNPKAIFFKGAEIVSLFEKLNLVLIDRYAEYLFLTKDKTKSCQSYVKHKLFA